ncbi:hypothetical protein HBI05_175350 [Parastagonospora nodorum]|nr:hypothetical protein HBI05_175350 [Parastagonospora nodorum]
MRSQRGGVQQGSGWAPSQNTLESRPPFHLHPSLRRASASPFPIRQFHPATIASHQKHLIVHFPMAARWAVAPWSWEGEAGTHFVCHWFAGPAFGSAGVDG